MGASESGSSNTCSSPCCNPAGEESAPTITEFAPQGVLDVEEVESVAAAASVDATDADKSSKADPDGVAGPARGSQSQLAPETALPRPVPAPPSVRLPQGPPATRFDEELQELRALPSGGPDGLRPLHRFSSGATYLGQWRGNSRHGEGLQTWADGARYAGRWSDNCAEGLGELQHPRGDTYTGEWKANRASGSGVYRDGKGLATYTGNWAEDLMHGYGTERKVSEYHYHGRLVLSGATQYQGQFVRGKKEGFGVFEWPDTSRYCGQWRANVMEGIGHYLDPDKRDFRGQWSDSMFHGMGKYIWPNGDTFSGCYEKDLRHGFGIFRSKYGKKSLGWWAQGKRNGGGVYYLSDGTLALEGTWQDGNFVDRTPAKT